MHQEGGFRAALLAFLEPIRLQIKIWPNFTRLLMWRCRGTSTAAFQFEEETE
jgi:hypothetical protein